MQSLEILHPRKRDMIVGPASRNRDRYFIVARALERPVVMARDMLDHVHWVDFASKLEFEKFHKMLPVVTGAPPRAPRESHTRRTKFANSDWQDGMAQQTPRRTPAARHMIRLRIMQQIQSIDAESRDQPLFA